MYYICFSPPFSISPETVCEYFAHIECQDFAVPDCKENATYVPGKDLSSFKHQVCVRQNHTYLWCHWLLYASTISSLCRESSIKRRLTQFLSVSPAHIYFVQHHWREGNLPQTSKCAYCKKTCWSSECLTGENSSITSIYGNNPVGKIHFGWLLICK